jgi:hypothetical protein
MLGRSRLRTSPAKPWRVDLTVSIRLKGAQRHPIALHVLVPLRDVLHFVKSYTQGFYDDPTWVRGQLLR